MFPNESCARTSNVKRDQLSLNANGGNQHSLILKTLFIHLQTLLMLTYIFRSFFAAIASVKVADVWLL